MHSAAGSSSQKQDRGALEKQRRVEMRSLYTHLASLLPPQPTKDRMSLPNILDKAEAYIKGLKEKVDLMKEEKERLQKLAVPSIVINEMNSFLEINLLLIPGSDSRFTLHEALIILIEAGVHDVLNVDYANFNDKKLYSIRCRAISARIGVDTSSVRERLWALIRSSGSSSVPRPEK